MEVACSLKMEVACSSEVLLCVRDDQSARFPRSSKLNGKLLQCQCLSILVYFSHLATGLSILSQWNLTPLATFMMHVCWVHELYMF
jgi:hypothetical protein